MRRLSLLVASLVLLGTATFVGQSSLASAASPGTTITLNSAGGTNATDGLKIVYAGGQIQVYRDGTEQLYAVAPPSRFTYNQIVLAVGDTTNGGTLFAPAEYLGQGLAPNVARVGWETVSSSTDSGLTSTLTGVANGLTYSVTVEINYVAPNLDFEVVYTVDVPTGNTDQIRLYHAFDSYLGDSDFGPGFHLPATSCPNGVTAGQVVGVDKSSEGIVESIQYVDGQQWAGYASGAYWEILDTKVEVGLSLVLGSWGQGVMTDYTNLINSNPATDNGFGVNWSFGSSPGSYSSTSKFSFASELPDPCEGNYPDPTPTTSTTQGGGDPVVPVFAG